MDHSDFDIRRVAAVIGALLLNPEAAFARDESDALRQQLAEIKHQMQRLQQTYEQKIDALDSAWSDRNQNQIEVPRQPLPLPYRHHPLQR